MDRNDQRLFNPSPKLSPLMVSNRLYRRIPKPEELKSDEPKLRSVNTRFVFRVFDKYSQGKYTEEGGFIAGRFLNTNGSAKFPEVEELYASVAQHVDREVFASPWISTSRRWDWAIWEMCRRQRRSGDIDIRVAVIDTATILPVDGQSYWGGRIHALQFLKSGYLGHQNWPKGNLWNLQNFSNMADELMFYGGIPPHAIVSVVNLKKIEVHVPGRQSGWLNEETFRAAHETMFRYHVSNPSTWSTPDLYASQSVELALNMLRPYYLKVMRSIALVFLDGLVTSFPVPMIPDLTFHDERVEGIQSLADQIPALSLSDLDPINQMPSISAARNPVSHSEPTEGDRSIAIALTIQEMYEVTERTVLSRYQKLNEFFPELPPNVMFRSSGRLFQIRLSQNQLSEDYFYAWSRYHAIEKAFDPLVKLISGDTGQSDEAFRSLWSVLVQTIGGDSTEVLKTLVLDRRPLQLSSPRLDRLAAARDMFETFRGRLLSLAHILPLSHLDAIDSTKWNGYKQTLSHSIDRHLRPFSEVLELFDVLKLDSEPFSEYEFCKSSFKMDVELYKP
ncbi:hypothetical protein RhiJN_21639 [Ceratobasidium sp. AG-Ba]|nr:hypothetical protein RhiJN_21639 [Ceratobasidium sp. AG-Ba]